MSLSTYLRSTALDELETGLNEQQQALKLVAHPSKQAPLLKNYVIGATVMFSSAALENYLTDIFSNYAQGICSKIKRIGICPEQTTGWIFINSGVEQDFKRYLYTGDENDFISRMGIRLKTEVAAKQDDFYSINQFRDFTKKCYPSTKNIKLMFKRIGIPNIFVRLSARAHRNIENEVESLNAIRGQFAHVGVLGTVSYKDTKNLIKSVRSIACLIDKEFFYHLRESNCVDIWRS
jgi:hypothetical protein